MKRADRLAKFSAMFSFLLLTCASLAAQSGRLDFADKARMVSCDPSTSKPCFRLKFNVVDAQGAPLNVNIPPDKDLRQDLKIYVNDQEITPFFAVSQTGDKSAVRGRVALILVDISGSMNKVLASGKTRFETAKEALEQFLEGFNNSADRVAIVPFESHNVAATIRAAHFATTKSEAEIQIGALPNPGPRNNTALYSAVDLGLDVLSAEAGSNRNTSGVGSPETLLLLMTDGKNEVYRGDDPGLLDGAESLNQVAGKVQASGIQVIGVGFGDPGSVDEGALQRLSTKYYMAEDAESLKRIFTFARTLLTNRIRATFAVPWDDRASLAGKTLHIKAKLKLPDGQVIGSSEQSWEPPEIGVPTFEGKCETEELKAALPIVPTSGNWLSFLRPILVFVGLGTLLLILWFWVPRLVWPEQYIGSFAVARGGGRWAEMSRAFSGVKPKPSRPAPPGFETRKGGVRTPARAPADRTVVQPQPDFSRSRLQKRSPQDDSDR